MSNNGSKKCQMHLFFHFETMLSSGFRGFLYFMALAYCFIGLSAITDRFFRSMENVVKHSRRVEEIDPCTNAKVVRYRKVWNYAVADIALLAFGTSFPQISLATVDAIRNLGNLYAGGPSLFYAFYIICSKICVMVLAERGMLEKNFIYKQVTGLRFLKSLYEVL